MDSPKSCSSLILVLTLMTMTLDLNNVGAWASSGASESILRSYVKREVPSVDDYMLRAKRDVSTVSRQYCNRPDFNNINPCFTPQHSKCSIDYTWTSVGCVINATCAHLGLNPSPNPSSVAALLDGDTSVCWVAAHGFSGGPELQGLYNVFVTTAGLNGNGHSEHSFASPGLTGAMTMESMINCFKLRHGLSHYNVVIGMPTS